MLLKMLPDQVADQWETIWPAIEIVIPLHNRTEQSKSNILHNIMSGNMHCWVLKDDEDVDVYAVATTCYFYDPCGSRSLFIYSLYGIRPISLEMWGAAFETLESWARGNGCESILSHTANKRMIQLIKYLGGDADEVIAILNISKNGKHEDAKQLVEGGNSGS
jgi:hypothetical protein